ncbi:NADH-ubiquinone oxidoreductase [Escherichia coli]
MRILAGAMANGHINLMVAGLVGAFMTSLYTFRMIFIVFHGKEQIHAHAVKGVTQPAADCAADPFHLRWRTDCAAAAGRASANDGAGARQHVMTLEITSGVVAVVGILLAAWLWLGKRHSGDLHCQQCAGLLGTWWYNAWGFDWLYDKVFVKPFLVYCLVAERDPLNSMMNIPAVLPALQVKVCC